MTVFIGAIIKDEHLDIREWVQHNQVIGIEHIWLYDNNSSRGYDYELGDFNKDGYVDIVSWPSQELYRQCAAYADFCSTRRWGDSDFGAFVDPDEFIIFDRHRTVQDFLDDYLEFAGVVLSWVTYGADGRVTRPDLPVREAYRRPVPLIRPNHNFKSIARFNDVAFWNDPHLFAPRHGKRLVNTRREGIYSSLSVEQVLDHAHIDHYITKSWEDYVRRLRRGNCTPGIRKVKEFFAYNKDMIPMRDDLTSNIDTEEFPTIEAAPELLQIASAVYASDIILKLKEASDDAIMSDREFQSVCTDQLIRFGVLHMSAVSQIFKKSWQELNVLKRQCDDLVEKQVAFLVGIPSDTRDYRRTMVDVVLRTPFPINAVHVSQ